MTLNQLKNFQVYFESVIRIFKLTIFDLKREINN
jgi:hypothetical protein